MGKIDRAVRLGVRDLAREARVSLKDGIESRWRGRRLVPVDQWEEISTAFLSKNYRKVLEYMPEEHVDYAFYFVPQSEEETKARELWYKDWIEYLAEKKVPSYGKWICRQCILDRKSERDFEWIRELMILGDNMEHPCSVLDFFKCPFDEKSRSRLFNLKAIFELVKKSLYLATSLYMYNKKTYFAYFHANYLERWFDYWYDSITWKGPLDETLEPLKVSIIPVNTIQDIFDILTSDNLGMIIEQYLEHLRKEIVRRSKDKMYQRYYENLQENIKHLEELKPKAVQFFKSIQSKIKIENVYDSSGRNLEEERQELARLDDCNKWCLRNNPELIERQTQPRSGLCIDCNLFANILCKNCDKWICIRHWKAHGVQVHQYNS